MPFKAGAIVSSLVLDKSKFTASVKGVKKQTTAMGGWVQKNSKQFKQMGVAIAAMGVTALVTFKKMVDQFVETGDWIDKMTKRTGFSATALSELAHAADISGASLNDVEKGVKRMARTITDAGEGLESYLRPLNRIGLELEELQAMNPEEQFIAITEAIADLEDPTMRAATAQEIFGRAGTTLLPLMAEGAEGLKKLREEAHELGIIFDEEAAAKAAKLKDAQTALNKAIQGVSFAIVSETIPVLTQMANHFKNVFVNVRSNAKSFTAGILTFLKAISFGVMGLMLAWNGFQLLVFEGAGLVTKHLRDLVIQILKMFVVMEKFPLIGGKFKGVTDALWDAFKTLDFITEGYNDTADATGEKMASIIEGFEKWFEVINNVKGGLKDLEPVITTTTEVVATELGKSSTEVWDTLMGLKDAHGEYVATWGKQSKELTKGEEAAMHAMMTAYGGSLESILDFFEKWAAAALIKWVMTTVPFPFNLIAAPVAMIALKGLFSGIKSMQEGGFVPEETIAHLHPGEFVVPAKDVERGGMGARVDIVFAPVFHLPTTDPVTMRDIVRLQIAPEMLEMFRSKILLGEFQKAMGV